MNIKENSEFIAGVVNDVRPELEQLVKDLEKTKETINKSLTDILIIK